MRIEFVTGDRKKESLITTFLKVFIIGWAIYFILFLLAEHFTIDVHLDFLLHDNYGNGHSDKFRDFFEVNRAAAIGDCYLTGECANYPPLVLAIAKFLSLFTPTILADANTWVTRDRTSGTVLFFVVFALLTLAVAWGFRSYLKKNLKEAEQDRHLATVLTVMLCLSYSLVFALERGNYIFIALIAFLVFAFTYRDHPVLSAVALAICACIKVYPVLLFVVYLIDKRWKGFFIGVGTGIVGLFLPMLALNGTLVQQFMGLLNGVLNFNNNSQATKGEVLFNHVEQHSNSFENIFRMISVALFGKESLTGTPALVTDILSAVSSVALVLLIVAAVAVLIFAKERWKSFFVINALLCLIPSNTFDYMLTFFLPILILVLCEGKLENRKYVILLTFLACVPKNYYYFGTYYEDVSIQCAINPLIMTVILGMLFADTALPGARQWIGRLRQRKKNFVEESAQQV